MDIILHHYGLSTFAAKARMILNYKGISWRSVEVPMILSLIHISEPTRPY